MRKKISAKKRVRRKKIEAKIRKVHEDNPELTQKQVLGKAFGILRHERKKK